MRREKWAVISRGLQHIDSRQGDLCSLFYILWLPFLGLEVTQEWQEAQRRHPSLSQRPGRKSLPKGYMFYGLPQPWTDPMPGFFPGPPRERALLSPP